MHYKMGIVQIEVPEINKTLQYHFFLTVFILEENFAILWMEFHQTQYVGYPMHKFPLIQGMKITQLFYLN